MFCHKCGTQVDGGAGFCHKCGAKIVYTATEQPAAPASPTTDRQRTDDTAESLPQASAAPVQAIERANISTDNANDFKTFADNHVQSTTKFKSADDVGQHQGTPVDGADTIPHCKGCGAVLEDGCGTCKSCGRVFASPLERGTASAGVGIKDFLNVNIWTEMFEEFKKMSIARKVITVLGVLLAVGIVILVLVVIFRLIFSSVVSVIVTAALGYIAYHKWGAISVTQHKYNNASKELQLPEGMTAQTLLEALNGKFNYPYFKGVRYGENGECIIEGRYSIYPVMFSENNKATLTCDLKVDEKKLRATMLEAIAIRSYINKFFNPFLPFDAVKDLKSLKSAEKQRKTVAIVLSVASTLVIIAIVLEYALPGSLQRIVKPGVEVREAYLTQYSETVTVETAFENFFDNEKWSTYEAEGYSYVAFTGACEFMGEKTDIKITFKITGEQFFVDGLDMNGRAQGELMVYSMLSKVYEDYEDK